MAQRGIYYYWNYPGRENEVYLYDEFNSDNSITIRTFETWSMDIMRNNPNDASKLVDLIEYLTINNGEVNFSHWNTQPDGSGDKYYPEENVNINDPVLYLYAIWGSNSSIQKYWVTDTQLTLLADIIREKGNTSESLTYPDDFVEAIDNLSDMEQLLVDDFNSVTDFNQIYLTTKDELESIANAIRTKGEFEDNLTFIEDFIEELMNMSNEVMS